MMTKNRVNIVLYLLLLSVYMYTYLGMLWELETLKLKSWIVFYMQHTLFYENVITISQAYE